MPGSFLFKRRQILYLGGTGTVSFVGGLMAAKTVTAQTNPTGLSSNSSLSQGDKQRYLHPDGFDQQFLTKSADIKQIWDFVVNDEIQSGGFATIRNALNAFQFTYGKTLYPVICLRGISVIYALNDDLWNKYNIEALYGKNGGTTRGNPLYLRKTTDNGKLSPEDPNSLYQETSLQALQQRGVHIVACYDAISGLSVQLAERHGFLLGSVLNELEAHLIPGASQTPSGSSLIAIAQYFGFTYAKQS